MSIKEKENEVFIDYYETDFIGLEHTNFYAESNEIGPILISIKTEDSIYFIFIRCVLGFEVIKIEEKTLLFKEEIVFLLKIALDQYFLKIFGESWIVKPEAKIQKEKGGFLSFLSNESEKLVKFFDPSEIRKQILTNLQENDRIFGSMNILSTSFKIKNNEPLCFIDKIINDTELTVKILKPNETKFNDLLGTEIKKYYIFNIKQIMQIKQKKEPKKEIKFKKNNVELKKRIKDFISAEFNYNFDLFLLINDFFKEIKDKNDLEGKNFYLKRVINNLESLFNYTYNLFYYFNNVFISSENQLSFEETISFLKDKELFENHLNNIFEDDFDLILVLEKIFIILDSGVEDLQLYNNFIMQSLDYVDKIFSADNLKSLNVNFSNILSWKTIFKKPQQKLFHYILFIEDFVKYLPENKELKILGLEIIERIKDFLNEMNSKKMLMDSLNETIKLKKKIKENDFIHCSEENILIFKIESLEENHTYAFFTEFMVILQENEDFYEIIVKDSYINILIIEANCKYISLLIQNKIYVFKNEENNITNFLDAFYILKNHFIFLTSNFDSLFFMSHKDKRIFYFVGEAEEEPEDTDTFIFTFSNNAEKNDFYLTKFNSQKELFKLSKSNEDGTFSPLTKNTTSFHDSVIEEFKNNIKKPPFDKNILMKFKIQTEKSKFKKEEKLREEVKKYFNFYNQISYKNFNFLCDYVHFYLINCHNEKNFASRETLSIVKNTSESNFFLSLSNFSLKEVEYHLEGIKISESKMSQLIFYEDLFLPHRNTIKELYKEYTKETEVKEDYLRKYRIEDLTALIVFWFKQNVFTLFPSENLIRIIEKLENDFYPTFTDLSNLSFKSTNHFLKRYFDFLYEVSQFIKNDSIFRLLDFFTDDYKTLSNFIKNILNNYNK